MIDLEFKYSPQNMGLPAKDQFGGLVVAIKQKVLNFFEAVKLAFDAAIVGMDVISIEDLRISLDELTTMKAFNVRFASSCDLIADHQQSWNSLGLGIKTTVYVKHRRSQRALSKIES